METLSNNSAQNTTEKCSKRHLPQITISRKVIAFKELTSSAKGISNRKAAGILGVSNSTMQSWTKQIEKGKLSQIQEFFSSDIGQQVLSKIVMAIMFQMKTGSTGIRGVQEFLQNSHLCEVVASSEGALQEYWKRCEDFIIEFGDQEETRLALLLKNKKVTIGLDEMFRGRRPCLVAIDVVSNYILVEKFTKDRKAETWENELKPRLEKLNLECVQGVGDLCGAINSVITNFGATYAPELFHAQYDISKATAAPLFSQEVAAEKELKKAEETLNKLIIKPRRIEIKECKKQELEIEKATNYRNELKIKYDQKAERRKQVRTAIKELGKIYHPIDLRIGKLQTADEIAERFKKQFEIIHKCAKEANLSRIDLIEKAERTFDKIVAYTKYFFTLYNALVENLELTDEHKTFFNNVVFPLTYLKMARRRWDKKSQRECEQLLKILESSMNNASWSEELKQEWMKNAEEIAERFQRSSSCVEGRNGVLSLDYQRFHRLSERTVRVHTIVHNFNVRRKDGTTAAERLFRAKHGNLFEALLANVRIPGRPQHQHHDVEKRKLAWEKRLDV